jgi:hypothetical protein
MNQNNIIIAMLVIAFAAGVSILATNSILTNDTKTELSTNYIPSDMSKAFPELDGVLTGGYVTMTTTNIEDVKDQIQYTIRGAVVKIGEIEEWTDPTPQPEELRKIMGKKVGIDEARQISKAEVKVPTKLPESTSLIQSYVSDDGERVTILYSNPKLETIKNFGATELPESQIIVTMQKMTNNPIQNIGESLPVIITVQEEGKPEKAVEVKPTTPTFDYTTINGVDGVIIQKRSEQNRPFSEISWWSNNTLYQIYADLPSSELQKIAESMQ